MKFVKRTLQSEAGLSQEDALISLQNSPQFKPGTKIASIRRNGPRWLVDLLEPKLAGPPPAFADDGEDDGPEESGPPSDGPEGPPEDDLDEGPPEESGPPSDDEGGEDGPPKPKGEGKEKPGGKGGVEEAILHTLTQILHALQGGGPEGMGGPDALGPGPGSPATPPPPHGGPPGLGGPPKGPAGAGPAGGAGAKLRPGETRNTPGTVPVGAPAFSSTREALVPGAPAPVPAATGTGPVPGPTGAQGQPGVCPECGYPEPCPMHGGGAQAPMSTPLAAVTAQVQKLAGRSRHISLAAPGDMKVSDAVEVAREATAKFGYKVEKAKRVNGRLIIVASAN